MTQATIYHNPKCSKSRATLKLLIDNGIQHQVIEYLNAVPNKDQFIKIIAAGVNIKDLVRTQEDQWLALNINLADANENVIIDAIIANPQIMQRPIVTYGGRALITRPPEKLLELL